MRSRLATSTTLLMAVILFLAAGVVAPLAIDTGVVSLSGRIFQPDGTSPYAGAVVRITNQDTGESFIAQSTDAAGQYSFQDLPSGTYTFEVEVAEGIYKLDRAVRIGDSDTASISFTVKPEQTEKAPGALPASGGGLSKGGLVAIIAGGAALVAVAAGGGGSGGEASPFTP